MGWFTGFAVGLIYGCLGLMIYMSYNSCTMILGKWLTCF